MKSIFVQIASYRDPELIPTIKDLIEKASKPENLKICIAHQYAEEDEWDRLDQFADDGRFTVIQIPYQESQGTCWARNEIQRHYNGEDYTLHLDSHHRFCKDWDTECIDIITNLQKEGFKKPLLTSYCPSYSLPDGKKIDDIVYGMRVNIWKDGVALFHPYAMEKTAAPVPSRFYSGHFAFTLGQFCKEVPHDPLMYFYGEEISISVRAYTHGYDLFAPHKQLVWHEYTREGRSKHWDDHSRWFDRDNASKARTRQLLGVNGEVCSPCNKNTFKEYGLGEARTLEEYEVYAGIKFKDQTITHRCKKNLPPPGIPGDSIYYEAKDYQIKLNKYDFLYDDIAFATVVMEDDAGMVVHQDTITVEEIKTLKQSDLPYVAVTRSITGANPLRYLIWPYSQSHGWGDKVVSYF